MAEPDYSTWLPKQQAADAIGVSTKTLESMAKAGQLQQAFWRRPTGGPALAVYHPDDVARLAQERRPGPAPFVVPASQPHASGNGHANGALVSIDTPGGFAPLPAGDDPIRLLFAAALRAVTSQSSEKKCFLTLAEAEAASGLPRRELRRFIVEGKLVPVCGRSSRSWRIRRRDLEQL